MNSTQLETTKSKIKNYLSQFLEGQEVTDDREKKALDRQLLLVFRRTRSN